jgi:BirA family biotin operon repressor/biotin-[acetyl-CoA-carboxylase] ligase
VLSSRTPIDPRRVSTLLSGPRRWGIEHVPVTGSTNADLAAEAAESASGRVLVTEEQLQGRGRAGRGWICPPGAGLMFSVLLREPAIPPERRGWLGAALGVGIAHAIRETSDLPAELKWPNDVLIGGLKCAGILGEVTGDALIVGSGINVTVDRSDLPRADATSLWLAGASRLDRSELLAAILDDFGSTLDRWVAAGGNVDAGGLRERYLQVCSTVGTPVRVELPGGRLVTAWATDVDPSGALVVRDDRGVSASYSAADVVHLRPEQ